MPENLDFAMLSSHLHASMTHEVGLRRSELPLAGSQRTQWRQACLLFVLSRCRGKSATIEQLHTLMWVMRGEDRALSFMSAWNGDSAGTRVLRAWEPGLMVTINLSGAAGLTEFTSTGRVKLTAAGEIVLLAIVEAEVNLGEPQRVLESIPPITTSDMWRRLGVR